jgi:hypothetical protein
MRCARTPKSVTCCAGPSPWCCHDKRCAVAVSDFSSSAVGSKHLHISMACPPSVLSAQFTRQRLAQPALLLLKQALGLLALLTLSTYHPVKPWQLDPIPQMTVSRNSAPVPECTEQLFAHKLLAWQPRADTSTARHA